MLSTWTIESKDHTVCSRPMRTARWSVRRTRVDGRTFGLDKLDARFPTGQLESIILISRDHKPVGSWQIARSAIDNLYTDEAGLRRYRARRTEPVDTPG